MKVRANNSAVIHHRAGTNVRVDGRHVCVAPLALGRNQGLRARVRRGVVDLRSTAHTQLRCRMDECPYGSYDVARAYV
jgi:hypothetical protein